MRGRVSIRRVSRDTTALLSWKDQTEHLVDCMQLNASGLSEGLDAGVVDLELAEGVGVGARSLQLTHIGDAKAVDVGRVAEELSEIL